MEKPEHYFEAVTFVRSEKRVGVSMLQRRFRLGYGCAALLVKEMEKDGVVTEPGMNGARTVIEPYITFEPPSIKHFAEQAHIVAEKRWHEYACSCEVGPERNRAFEIYENIRVATRVPLESN